MHTCLNDPDKAPDVAPRSYLMKKRLMPQAKIIGPSVASYSNSTAATLRPLHYKLFPPTRFGDTSVSLSASVRASVLCTLNPTAAFEKLTISLSVKVGSGLEFLIIGVCLITNLRRSAKSASLREC